MSNEEIMVFVFLILISTILVGNGLTGLIISESCCFPPHCTKENTCSFSQNNDPGNNLGKILAGTLLILGTITLYWMQKKIR